MQVPNGSIRLRMPAAVHSGGPVIRRIVLVLVGLMMACATRVDRIAVHDARLLATEYLEDGAEGSSAPVENRALSMHRITRGSGTVFSKRTYDPGSLFSIDDEQFEFISWMVPKSHTGILDVQSDLVAVFYSRGSSAFPEQACFGVAKSGYLDIRPGMNGATQVRMSMVIAKGELVSGEECPEREVHDDGIFVPKEVTDLTPWLGGPFEYPYQASYPR